MPTPESITSISAVPLLSRSTTRTRPPTGVNLIALDSRLSIACPRRSRSPNMATAVPGVSIETVSCASSARGRAASTDSRTTRSRSISAERMASPDSSIATRVSRSSTRRELALGAAHDHREEALALGAELLEVGHQLAVADHRGERGAQLVGDGGEELVLDPVGLLLHPRRSEMSRTAAETSSPSSVSSGERRHLDRELRAVLAAGVQVAGEAHRAGARLADVAVAERHVHPGEPVGHQDLHRLPDQLGPLVAEEPLDLGVDQHDDAVAVDDDHAVGSGLEQATEELGLAVLVVRLAHADGHQRTAVGERRRSASGRRCSSCRWCAASLASRTVTSIVVLDHRRDGDLLEGVHRLAAEVLDGVSGHRLGGDADDSPAALLASRTTPCASPRTIASST